MTHPLSGIRVLEVANFIAGPFCAAQLADLGADVVKVEDPRRGDNVRQTGPFLPGGESSPFARLNRNKRSLALDLKAPEGKEIFRRLAARADVVVENLRPGAMAGLGLDYPSLEPANPGLVYLQASAFGPEGPLASQPGLDIIVQGMAGLLSVTGEEGGAPVKAGVPICDLACALYGALAVVAALVARQESGRGQLVEVNLFEAGASLTLWEAGRYLATGEVPGPLGSAHQTAAPYQAIRTADGHITVGAITPPTWEAFCRALELPELVADPRFADNPSRHANRRELIALVEEVTDKKPAAEWLATLRQAGVPCGPINTYDQVVADPQLEANGFFRSAPHAQAGPLTVLGSPMHFSATPGRIERAGPLLGEHSLEVLAEAGVSSGEAQALRRAGIVATP
jgi:crotonobetainyl-CoA:carnitine CoA-transferase CaiB-like acyl-CoA transferase